MNKTLTKSKIVATLALTLFALFCSTENAHPQATNLDTLTQMLPPSDGYNFQGNQKVSFHYFSKEQEFATQSVGIIYADKRKNIGGTNRLNSFAGLLPGVIIGQTGSIPGKEGTQTRIRGINSFGISRSVPVILYDGVETDINNIDPHTIEKITVLKDAAATAMFGLRGASGVILIESKKGEQGPVKISVNSQGSIVQPIKTPSFLGAYDYARLYNEALVNDGMNPLYTEDEITKFREGTDPYFYPDINWLENYLSDYSYQTRNNITVSAADQDINYFFAINNVQHSGLFNTDEEVNTYNTNTGYSSTGLQARMAYSAIPGLNISADIKGRFETRRTPGSYENFENNFFGNLFNTPPTAHPIKNPDGSLAGTQDFRNNIYGELNHTGYSIWERTKISSVLNINYELDWLLSGLQLKSQAGYVNYSDHITDRSKEFAVFQYLGNDQYNQIGQNTPMNNTSSYDENLRRLSFEMGLDYQHDLGNDRLSAGIYGEFREENQRVAKLPRVYQALRGFAGYNMQQKYLLDVVFSYMGSEQFPTENRYGFFPAISLGWLISEEDFVNNISAIDFIKFRGSYGLTGNDFNPYVNNNPYFGYLENYSPGNGYHFGYNTAWQQGFYEVNAENPAIIWETISKANAGFDGMFFNKRLNISADYFKEESKDILILGANEQIMGYEFWFPAGIASNSGIDATIGWQDKNGDLGYTFSGMFLYAENKIIEQQEPVFDYEWMQTTGNPINSVFGYTFDRFFTENDDRNTLPDHSMLGQLRPGSLIYKDLNNDNVIDERDISMIAQPNLPKIYFGFNTGIEYRNFDLNILFQGVAGSEIIFNNPFMFEFYQNTGNVTENHLDRWTPGSGQDASYPSLSLSGSDINRVNSTFWVKNRNYLRIKSAEIGYSLPQNWLNNYGIKNLRFYVSGYNLHTWDNTGMLDPEYRSFGYSFPLTRYFSGGLNLTF
jgi:TonB-linked SusC/RagA family outer membrane protein